MKEKFKLSIIMIVLMVLVLGACSDDSDQDSGTNNDDDIVENGDDVEDGDVEDADSSEEYDDVDESWDFVIELSSVDVDQLDSEVFTLRGTDVKIVYDIVTEETGGNALIYILEEGASLSQNAAGEIEVAQHDSMVVGTNAGEVIVSKDSGPHYLFVNSSSLESFSVRVYERP